MSRGLYKRYLTEKLERQRFEASLPITRFTNLPDGGCLVERIERHLVDGVPVETNIWAVQ